MIGLFFIGIVVTVIVMDVINITGSVSLGLIAVFGFCLLIGLINGLVRTVLNVNSLIATLAMMLILQGSVYVYSMAAIYNTHLIPLFSFIGQGFFLNIPMPVVIMLFILPFFPIYWTIHPKTLSSILIES